MVPTKDLSPAEEPEEEETLPQTSEHNQDNQDNQDGLADYQDLDEGESVIIDKNEMMETSDDQDILSSPSSQISFDTEGDQEIDGFTNFNIILEYPRLNYNYSLFGTFEEEINDWFSANDLKNLNTIKSFSGIDESIDIDLVLEECYNQLTELLQLEENSSNNSKILKCLLKLVYIILGNYGTAYCKDELVDRIVQASQIFVQNESLIRVIVQIIETRANKLADAENCEAKTALRRVKLWSAQLFYSLTILHVVILTFLKGLNHSAEDRKSLAKVLDQIGILESITHAIDKWRWISCESERNDPAGIIESLSNGNGADLQQKQQQQQQTNNEDNHEDGKKVPLSIIMSFKLRNVVICLSDLILFLFGDLQNTNSTKSLLKDCFDDTTLEDSTIDFTEQHATISSVDYRKYCHEIASRYPTFVPPKYDVSHILDLTLRNGQKNTSLSSPDFSGSVSLLSSQGDARSESDYASNLESAPASPPNVHIATPMPSPSLTPQHTGSMSDGDDINGFGGITEDVKKKMLLTQFDYPNIYPYDNDTPYSIKQAANIFYHHVRDTISSKQFTRVLESFIEDQRGMKDENNHDLRKYSTEKILMDKGERENPDYSINLESLRRVENFYRECLPYLSSLTYVLIQIISSNVIPTHNAKKAAYHARKQQSNLNGSGIAVDDVYKDTPKPYIPDKLTPSDKQKLEVLRMKESTLKSASVIIVMLSRWFKLSHIMKYEYFTSLLFDNNFISQSFRLLDSNKVASHWDQSYDFRDPESLINNRMVYCDYEVLYNLKDYNFFMKALSLSAMCEENFDAPSTINEQDEYSRIFDIKDSGPNKSVLSFILPFNSQCNICVKNPNHRYCLIINNLFQEVYSIISHFKIQRIYKLLEVRPTDTLRFYLTLFNAEFYKPILKIIKLMSPFSGKKWRANNMDMISFVYLFYKVGLQDQWLTNYFTGTLEERLKVSYENEFSLRCLMKYYNLKNYRATLEKFGYKYMYDDFIKNDHQTKKLTDFGVSDNLSEKFKDMLQLEQ